MINDITKHQAYMNQQLTKKLKKDERQQLFQYHQIRVQDFQHERLIHLLVTFFFGFLTILAIASCFLLTPIIPELTLLLFALSGLLFILEIFYIAHYYKLENGVQSLYDITRKFR